MQKSSISVGNYVFVVSRGFIGPLSRKEIAPQLNLSEVLVGIHPAHRECGVIPRGIAGLKWADANDYTRLGSTAQMTTVQEQPIVTK